MLNKYGQAGGLNAGLSLWLPFNDLGAGAVDTSAAYAAGSATPTFTRATTATTFDVNGTAPISVASGTARSYYDPASHVYQGYLAEQAATNLLLNSLINGTNLGTQSVTVTAQAYTLSFYGTGTVTLSGTATGAKVGTGAYPTRSSFTFTPTAGTLTLTVTGTVQYAQLETGSFATSFIPTAGATVTRNADVLTYPSSGNIDSTVGSLYAECTSIKAFTTISQVIVQGAAAEGAPAYFASTPTNGLNAFDVTAARGLVAQSSPISSAIKTATQWSGAAFKGTIGGAAPSSATFDGSLNIGATLGVGSSADGQNQFNGTLKNLRIYTRALADSQLVSLTS